MKSRSHEQATIESFKKDPQFAADYLNAILEEGSQEELMGALRYISDAFGGITSLAKQADLNGNTLYRTLSSQGNPRLSSLLAILHSMGMRLAVMPIQASRK